VVFSVKKLPRPREIASGLQFVHTYFNEKAPLDRIEIRGYHLEGKIQDGDER
jgi:hypothetical protein